MANQLFDSSPWEELPTFPFNYFTQPLFLNNTEFVVIPSKHDLCASDGIYKFNTNANKWSKIIHYQFSEAIFVQTAAYCKDKQLLYVFCAKMDAKILIFDLKHNTQHIIDSPITGSDHHRMIYLNDHKELHQIGGDKVGIGPESGHYVWNKKMSHSKKINQFRCVKRVHSHGLIYLHSTKCILLFGGEISCTEYSDSVYQFCTMDRKWSQLNVKIPHKISNFGLVKCQNEKFIILFGGDNDGIDYDEIYVYNTQNMSFTQSKIYCPRRGQFHAVIHDNINSEYGTTLTFGFINDCYKSEYFSNVQMVSCDLIQLISRWVYIEQIYLLENENGNHWTINADVILNSL